ncbi:diaminobutyrate acetyltransferase [Paracoccus sp. T5]|uniref:diaminobutyrate acetyltransferase n=1 Tax=Paracoccus sp. T5 TaxID=3402161 RepID=UPI003AE63712
MPDKLQHTDRLRQPTMRRPRPTDGAAIWKLVRNCRPLDENSMYCNLVQADHFRDTCVVAEMNGDVVGWISGHLIPNQDALFIWQVAVSPQARGLGLGRKMLMNLLDRDICEDVTRLNTTITRDNDASWALFRSLARNLGGDLGDDPHYTRDRHFDGQHATEHMVTITLPRQQDHAQAA